LSAKASRAASGSATVSSTSAPATSVLPSEPSVSTAPSTAPSGRPAAAARANSPFGPPVPSPVTRTVVSPPERITAGGSTGSPLSAASAPIAAWIRPAAVDSPSIIVERTQVSYPPVDRQIAGRVDRVPHGGDDVYPDLRVGRSRRIDPGEVLPDRRNVETVPIEGAEGGRRVRPGRHRRAAGDDRGVVADDVADEDAGDRRRGRRGREAAALYRRAGPPDGVYLVDRRPGVQEAIGDGPDIAGREFAGRRTQERAAAAGDRRDDERVGVGRRRTVEDGARTRNAALAG